MSSTASHPAISTTLAPGDLANQLETLHGMGATSRVEIDMPDKTFGTIHLVAGSVHQAVWRDRVGISALAAMAVLGNGKLRMFPGDATIAPALHIFTPALIDYLRRAESTVRHGFTGDIDAVLGTPIPAPESTTDSVLEAAQVRIRQRDTKEPTPAAGTNADEFPDDWLGSLVPESAKTADQGDDEATGLLPVQAEWMPPAVGSMLGRCYLSAEIGQGATAIVYRALHITLKIDVAVKVFKPRSDGSRVVQLDEARLLARLNHPNIIRVLDCNEEGHYPYLVAEFIEGFSLGDMIEQSGALAPATALRVVLQAAEGLAYAAAKGVVHCDVKPGNILVSRLGKEAKIADLGLARSHDVTDDGQPMVKGTPAYISPEQIEGGDVTAKSDIYSLGATLYHAIAGAPPFSDPDPMQTMIKHLREQPQRLGSRVRDLDPRLERLVMNMLVKKANLRPDYAALIPDMRQVLRDLERGSSPALGDIKGRIFQTLNFAMDMVRKAIGKRTDA
jgi:tRNA A-37 threonylcarbamoyl transferase component Bud32